MDSEYEELYGLYPRKGGSDYWRQQCRDQLKTAEDIKGCREAITAYALVKRGTAQQYLKSFSNFMGEWQSWRSKPVAPPSEKVEYPACAKCRGDGFLQGRNDETGYQVVFRCPCPNGAKFKAPGVSVWNNDAGFTLSNDLTGESGLSSRELANKYAAGIRAMLQGAIKALPYDKTQRGELPYPEPPMPPEPPEAVKSPPLPFSPLELAWLRSLNLSPEEKRQAIEYKRAGGVFAIPEEFTLTIVV